jgi:hypothetical protein
MEQCPLLTEKKASELQLLTEQETSGLIKVPPQTLRNHRSKGFGLPYYKLGRSVRYSLADIDKYLSARKINTTRGES